MLVVFGAIVAHWMNWESGNSGCGSPFRCFRTEMVCVWVVATYLPTPVASFATADKINYNTSSLHRFNGRIVFVRIVLCNFVHTSQERFCTRTNWHIPEWSNEFPSKRSCLGITLKFMQDSQRIIVAKCGGRSSYTHRFYFQKFTIFSFRSNRYTSRNFALMLSSL